MRTRCSFLGLWIGATSLVGCSDCSDEVAVANDFLEEPAHLTCQTDSDCAVVFTGCGSPRRSFCGQAALNGEAAGSAKWRKISESLADCENDCSQCDGLLVVSCSKGQCGGPP